MSLRFILILAALFGATAARAEGGSCPPGYYPVNIPGVMSCAPIPGSGGADDTAPTGPRWRSQWIAVALDASIGAAGVARDQPSKSMARKVSVEKCIANGGTRKGCKMLASTSNQCLALAWGASYISTFGSPDEAGARRGAMDECSARSKGCELLFSNCSFPVRVD